VLSRLSDIDLAAVVAGAEAFCLPSLMEGFGLTVLEAMACGVPVVVSNLGSLPEVVGDAGVVCEPHVDDLEAALYDLLTDRDRMAQLSRDGLARSLRFTWQATARGWLRALEETVQVPRLGRFEWLAPPSRFITQRLNQGFRVPVQRRTWTRRG